MARLRTIVAVCLIVAGAVAMFGPAFGFSSIAADRGVQVSTADDPNAFVGLEPVDESIDGRQDTATVARIHNNLGAEMTLVTSVDQGADIAIDDEGFGSTVAAGGSTSLTLSCDTGGSSGTQSVVVTVDEASASGVVVEGATMTVDVDYQCTGGGKGGQLVVQSVSTGISTSEAVFEIENTGTKKAKVHGISLDGTSAAADEVNNGNGPEISIGGSTVNEQNGGISIDGVEQGISGNEQIGGGQTATITIGEYRAGGSTVELEGEEVEFTLYGSNGPLQSFSETIPVQVSNGGSVDTENDVVVEDGETANEIDSGGDVATGEDSRVNDEIDADGNVETGDGSTTHGEIGSGGDVTTGEGSTVNNGIDADGDVVLGAGSTTNGEVQGDSITVGENALVNDAISAEGDVILEDGSTVHGEIGTDGTVYIGCNVTTNGEIDAESVDDC